VLPRHPPARHFLRLTRVADVVDDKDVPSYKRYLEGYFRRKFELVGTPMAIEFRTGRDPYAGKAKNKPR
jgi:predicted GTPase